MMMMVVKFFFTVRPTGRFKNREPHALELGLGHNNRKREAGVQEAGANANDSAEGKTWWRGEGTHLRKHATSMHT